MRENGEHSPNVAYVHEVANVAHGPNGCVFGTTVIIPYEVEPEYLEELRMTLHAAAQSWCHGMNRKRILER